MSDAVSSSAASRTQLDILLAWLGIRTEDRAVTGLLFGNMFLSGLAIGMIRVCGFTLFLEHFSSEQLAIVAILLAITGTLITVVIDRLTAHVSVRGYMFAILGTIFVGLIVYRTLLGSFESEPLIFTLPLFFEIVYMLFSLQFLALMSRLLNVRQTKRLAGIARSGEFLAELVGGMSVAFLLNFMGVKDLLIVGAAATFAVFIVVNYTIRQFRDRLIITTSDLAAVDDHHDGRLLTMFRMPYVRLIALCYAAYIFAYFFLEVAFYDYASAQFQNEREMAEFIGRFFAIAGFLTLLAMVFLFAPFVRRFGILSGVIAFPIVVGIGSTSVSLMEIGGGDVALIFAVMVVTNGMRFILQSAIWRPSVAILFQVLPDRQRSRGTALIEGVVDPLSGGIAGVCLYLVSDYLDWPPKYFLLILTGLMAAWVIMGILVRRLYLSHLVVSIQKRKLGELSLAELDNASLNIIKKGLNSPYPAEIFYCLSILEELEHPEITELIKDVIPNGNDEVRMDVLRRIASMDIKPLTAKVDERINLEPEPRVKAQAMKTYAALGADNVVERLLPFLDARNMEIRKGALTGLLTYDPGNDTANAYLLSLVRSDDVADRSFAAEILGDIGLEQFSGYLVELLDDPDPSVTERAIFAAGQIRDDRLVNVLVSKMGNPVLQAAANHALKHHGEKALYDLDLGLTSPTAGRQEKINIIETIREIGGEHAIEILLRHIDIEMPELRHQVYLALATLQYQADPDDQYIFVNKLDEEVNKIAWLLAAMEDLYEAGPYRLVHSALGNELDVRRDNLLLLTSFLFPSIVMLETRANIDSKVSELRVFALEILENVLSTEVKQIVLPVLDDLSVSERLRFLQEKFPQRKMAPQSRFTDIVSEHMDASFYWTRATVLYQIGKDRNRIHADTLEASRQDKEPVIRETAIWALTRLNPPEVVKMLQAHLDDPNPQVVETVQSLLEEQQAVG